MASFVSTSARRHVGDGADGLQVGLARADDLHRGLARRQRDEGVQALREVVAREAPHGDAHQPLGVARRLVDGRVVDHAYSLRGVHAGVLELGLDDGGARLAAVSPPPSRAPRARPRRAR
jgi:hypothetical protein